MAAGRHHPAALPFAPLHASHPAALPFAPHHASGSVTAVGFPAEVRLRGVSELAPPPGRLQRGNAPILARGARPLPLAPGVGTNLILLKQISIAVGAVLNLPFALLHALGHLTRIHVMRHLDAVAIHHTAVAAPPGKPKLSPAHAEGHLIATYEYTAPVAAVLKRALSPLWVVLANPIVAFPIYTLMLMGMGIFHEANSWVGLMVVYGVLKLVGSGLKEGWAAVILPALYAFILGLMTGPSWEELQERWEELKEEAQRARNVAQEEAIERNKLKTADLL